MALVNPHKDLIFQSPMKPYHGFGQKFVNNSPVIHKFEGVPLLSPMRHLTLSPNLAARRNIFPPSRSEESGVGVSPRAFRSPPPTSSGQIFASPPTSVYGTPFPPNPDSFFPSTAPQFVSSPSTSVLRCPNSGGFAPPRFMSPVWAPLPSDFSPQMYLIQRQPDGDIHGTWSPRSVVPPPMIFKPFPSRSVYRTPTKEQMPSQTLDYESYGSDGWSYGHTLIPANPRVLNHRGFPRKHLDFNGFTPAEQEQIARGPQRTPQSGGTHHGHRIIGRQVNVLEGRRLAGGGFKTHWKQKFPMSEHVEKGIPLCSFCRRNGEMRSFYMGHRLRDDNNRLECPILRSYTCPHCGANGDEAHTESYCPKKQAPSPENVSYAKSLLNTPRNAAGYRGCK